jgi:hypothetical protein
MGNDMNGNSPSRIGNWLLSQIVAEHSREAILGDLAEECAVRARSAHETTVFCWYWGQVCRSIPPVLWQAFKSGRWLPTLLAALGAYIGAGLLEFTGTIALTKLVPPDGRYYRLLILIIGLTTMGMGGFVAAGIRRRAATVLAGIVLIVVAVLMVMFGDSAPLWYQIAFLSLGPLTAYGGGSLWLRTHQ